MNMASVASPPVLEYIINSGLHILGSLSTRDFETRTASGSEVFSLIARLHTITFTMLSTISRVWMISIKMCETPLSWHTECSLPVAVCVSKTRVLKLTIRDFKIHYGEVPLRRL